MDRATTTHQARFAALPVESKGPTSLLSASSRSLGRRAAKGTASLTLYRRGKRWWVDVWIKGVRYTKSTGSRNRRVAEQIARRFYDDVLLRINNINQFQPELPFSDLYAAFVARGCPKPYHIDRAKLLLPFFGKIQIGQLTKNLVRQFRAQRHRARKLSESTVNRDIEALRSILFWAVDEGLLANNPLTRIRLVRERAKRRPVLSVSDEGKLLGAAPEHVRYMILTAVDTGMRRGELLSQRWEDVDFAGRALFVTHSKTPEGESREVPMTNRLFDLLWSRRKENGLVFTFNGVPIRTIKTAWNAAIRRAGIRYLRFHDLRHTFNNRLLEAGVMREVRMALMGHSGGDVHSMYVNIESPLRREAIRRLERWMSRRAAEGSIVEPKREI